MRLSEFMSLVDQEWEAGQLHEMANVFPKRHGIENVVIWVGRAPKQHGLRVKVSNVPNKMSMEDSFVIMLPSLDFDPKRVAPWITKKTMQKIVEWIKLNQQLLYDYENGLIDDTEEFLLQIAKGSH